jgi:hypothetical protein
MWESLGGRILEKLSLRTLPNIPFLPSFKLKALSLQKIKLDKNIFINFLEKCDIEILDIMVCDGMLNFQLEIFISSR